VAAVGVLGLMHDSSANSWSMWPAWLNLHGLFAMLLWLYVVAGFRREVHRQPAAEIHASARRLSRRVYLLLYGLMLFRLLVAILHGAPHHIDFGPFADFQWYLASGVAALATIQVLAAMSRRQSLHGAPSLPLKWVQGKGRLT
jgi:hypothetical protein